MTHNWAEYTQLTTTKQAWAEAKVPYAPTPDELAAERQRSVEELEHEDLVDILGGAVDV